MTDWRKDLKQASFRGVPFFVKESQYQGGRRIVMNEFPSTDDDDRDPYPEDLGHKARTYTLEAYVLNNELLPDGKKVGKAYANYHEWRDAFIDALEKRGPGTLVHPFMNKGGPLQVVMGVYTCSENFKEGGKATFNVPFMEAGAQPQPTAATDTAGAVQDAAKNASIAAQSSFSAKFKTSGLPSWVGSTAQLKLQQLTSSVNSLVDAVTAPLATVQQAEQQIEGLSSSVATLIATPSALAAEVVGMIATLGTIVQEPIQALGLYRDGLFGFGADDTPIPGTLDSQRQEEDNRQAINTLAVVSALTAYAQAAASVPSQSSPGSSSPSVGYDTSNAALTTLAGFLATFDAVVPSLDDDSNTAMADLRAAVVADLTQRAATLPSLVQYKTKVTRPAILIAWDRYGDATREQEICQRNMIADPGFVQGGTVLEVLNV